MTCDEWDASGDLGAMLEFLNSAAMGRDGVCVAPSERKLCLVNCAWCRAIWPLLTDERSRNAVDAAERYVDGNADPAELELTMCSAEAVLAQAKTNLKYHTARAPVDLLRRCWKGGVELRLAAEQAAMAAAWTIEESWKRKAEPDPTGERFGEAWAEAYGRAERDQCEMLRDIFGLLRFHSLNVDARWLAWSDGAVRKIAQQIYAERGFGRMPLLADALEDAGCADAAILSHCRGQGEHVRGCWVVDLLLGRSRF